MAKKTLVECTFCKGEGAVKESQLPDRISLTNAIGSAFNVATLPLPKRAEDDWTECPKCKGEGHVAVRIKQKHRKKNKKQNKSQPES